MPYLPGLDGMRALAVIAVLVYHANSHWLRGGFLGVEVFFVISGYLITLLLIAEKERSGSVSLRHFWLRRARRLLPALLAMLLMLTVWTALFKSSELGKLRGDVVGGLFYVANWYQIWVGAGYSAANDFAPLRHLWSLAVEEQFYLVWPLVMLLLLRNGSRRIADLSRWLFLVAIGVTVTMALLYHPGQIGTAEVTPEAYWQIGGRSISKADALYLGTLSRSAGLLLGSAFAMIWRPVAVMRGPLRERGRTLDLAAIAGLAVLTVMSVQVAFIDDAAVADAWLFRGGFFIASVATLAVIAAVTHERTLMSRVLATPPLVWIGVRSYGLYLYSWPIYQMIRGIAGKGLTVSEFAVAMVITVVVSELSFRYLETPIRRGALGAIRARLRSRRDPVGRNAVIAGAFAGTALTIFAAGSLATADLQQNAVEQSLEAGRETVCDVIADPTCAAAAAVGDAPVPTDPSAAVGAVDDPATVPTSDPAPETTVAGVQRIDRLAIGDSVMLGAAGQLAQYGFVVDAEESRFFAAGVDDVAQLAAEGRLGDIVVFHLGTNGPIAEADMERLLDTVADVPQVLLVTIDVDRDYTARNNSLIYGAAGSRPNVSLLDWQGNIRSCPGNCTYEDGFHLRPEGQAYYASLIAGALGLV